MSGTVCLDVFEQMGAENAKQVGWMLAMAHPTRLSTSWATADPTAGSFLNSACYRFADFIFAPSFLLRALENEFLLERHGRLYIVQLPVGFC